MISTLLNLYLKFLSAKHSEEGQDLVEYALLCTLISLALVTAISGISGAVNNAFSSISTRLGAV